MPAAPETAFWHLGAGNNMVYVDPENDLVIVARWIQGSGMNGLIERVTFALIKVTLFFTSFIKSPSHFWTGYLLQTYY